MRNFLSVPKHCTTLLQQAAGGYSAILLQTMASSAQASPRQRISSADLDAFDDFGSGPSMPSLGGGGAGGNRARLPSSEIPRTYSGLYGAGVSGHESHLSNDYSNDGDAAGSSSGNNMSHHQPSRTNNSNNSTYKAGSNLLPFELSRNRNTDWIAEGGPSLLLFYLLLILVVLLTFLAFVTEPKLAWTLTSIVHAVSTMVYLHWIKGNPADYMDGTQGEMNAMTCWEQIVSKPAKHHLDTRARTYTDESVDSWNSYSSSISVRQRMTIAIKKLRSRDVLCIIPTLLAHASCHVAKYQQEYVFVNVGVWAVVMLPKMPFMNGVRLFGINRTIGIDDGDYQAEDYDTPDETEEEDDNNNATTTSRTDDNDDCDLGLDIIDSTEEEETKKTR